MAWSDQYIQSQVMVYALHIWTAGRQHCSDNLASQKLSTEEAILCWWIRHPHASMCVLDCSQTMALLMLSAGLNGP